MSIQADQVTDTAIFTSGHAPSGDVLGLLGQRYYSYAIAEQGHAGALRRLNYRVTVLERPEAVTAAAWKSVLSTPQTRCVHLMFRNFRSLRPVHWAYNIAVLVWEFDTLLGLDGSHTNPFRNQVRMLNGCDEVWVASRHSQEVFRQYGVTNVHVVPCPVAERGGSDRAERAAARRALLQRPSVTLRSGIGGGAEPAKPLGDQDVMIDRERSTVFVSVLNPLDRRKQLHQLLAAFAVFSRERPDAHLLLKFSVFTGNHSIDNVLSGLLGGAYGGRGLWSTGNITILTDALPDQELGALYGMADFYVSATRGEGQNLALQEAMLSGAPVLAPRHTAMADYIDEHNAIVLPHRATLSPVGESPSYHAHGRMPWYETGMAELRAGFERAATLSPRARQALGQRGATTIMPQYGVERIAALMEARLSSARRVSAPR